jgi:hypothetical protein
VLRRVTRFGDTTSAAGTSWPLQPPVIEKLRLWKLLNSAEGIALLVLERMFWDTAWIAQPVERKRA